MTAPAGEATKLIADALVSKSLPTDGTNHSSAELPPPVGTVTMDKPPIGTTSVPLPGYTVGATTSPSPTTVPTTVMTATAHQPGVLQGSAVRRDSSLDERDQALRQRLKSAMANLGS